MHEARRFLAEILRPIYLPAARVGLADWAERWITLRPKESADSPGPYRRARSMLIPRLFDLFLLDPQWRKGIVKKGSQSSVTLHTLIAIVRRAAEDPVNVIYAINSDKVAGDISVRLRALLEDCPLTAGLVAEAGEDITSRRYRLAGMNIWLQGSHSAGDAAEKTAGLIVADELDKHGEPTGEASTLDLLEQRGKEVTGAKVLAFSTPTEESAATHKEWAKGSRHVAFVPCPHCGHFQELRWEGLKFEHCRKTRGWDLDRVERETYYECSACEGRIEERHKAGMLARGRWEATHYEEVTVDGEKARVPAWQPGVLSAHYSDFYSVHPNSTWGRIAVEWLTSQDSPKKRQNVLNGRFGRAVRPTVSEVRVGDVHRLRGEYRKGTLPCRPAVAVLVADSQAALQKWMRMAFSLRGDCWIVDWGKTLSYTDLDALFMAPIETPEGRVYCQRAMVDEGGKDGTSYEVRRFCAQRFPEFVPAKGRGGVQVRDTVVFSDSRLDRGGLETIPVCHFDDDAFKRLVYIQRIRRFDPRQCEEEGLPRIWLPQDADEGLIKELCSEHLQKRVGTGGREEMVWMVSGTQDWGDCLKMGHVLWSIIGPELAARKGGRG